MSLMLKVDLAMVVTKNKISVFVVGNFMYLLVVDYKVTQGVLLLYLCLVAGILYHVLH